MLPIWLPGYVALFGELSLEVTNALLKISPPTIDRILSPIRFHYTKRGRSTTKPGTLLRKKIPIKTNQWDEARPGFLEADTVAHCGDSTATPSVTFFNEATGPNHDGRFGGANSKISGILRIARGVIPGIPHHLTQRAI